MPDLTSDQMFQLAEQLAAMGDSNGALARCVDVLAIAPEHDGARSLSAALQLRSGVVAAYRINLKKRPDRLVKAMAAEARWGYPAGVIRRVEAIEDTDIGAIGCGKSHIAALTNAFLESESPYCMVVEDDFDFLEPAYALVERLAAMRNSGLRWDVLLLAGGNALPYEQTQRTPGLLRIFEARTTVGYVVNRHYLPTLLNCFAEAVIQLERFRPFDPRETIEKRFAIDIAWQALQRRDHWYIANPVLGHHRPGYSDIAECFFDYGTRNFYGWP